MSETTELTRSGRSRRRTTKAVDYAKEQEFSDNDVFEDGANADASPAVRKRRGGGRPRRSDHAERDFGEFDGPSMDYEPQRPRFVEKGYDPTLPPIRERFDFAPEFEPDGSPKIELIVGRRPIEEKSNAMKSSSGDVDAEAEVATQSDDEGVDLPDSSSSEDVTPKKRKKSRRQKAKKGKQKKKASPKGSATSPPAKKHVEYEYLVKYKGKSYLHLEWKTGPDLESMNKSAKTLYRRFLKKLQAGTEEDLEDPNFDPSYAEPGKIIDEEDQDVMVELSDKELVAWEKEHERERAEEEDEVAIEGLEENPDEIAEKEAKEVDTPKIDESPTESKPDEDAEEEIGDVGNLDIDQIRKILNKDGPYYPKFEGSVNPYADGYITTPPKKPRASYLFFQCCYRSQFQKKYAGASVGEIMTMLGDTWRAMTEVEQAPFLQLAKEEAEEHEKERAMMEKAQKPNEMWQPLRRCHMVLDRLSSDGFSSIFQEPVNTVDFPDYEEFVDQPMDLGTVRTKLENRKYQAPEIFARDVRKIWNNCKIYNQHGSAIWHVADYMSKQFERLYQAWVLAFRDRYLRWVNPQARPWEHTCRACDGKCGMPDDKMVLCDHCDAMFGMACLQPPLKKLPDGIWHCPDCLARIDTDKNVRMLSALSEHAARKRAELGDVPKKRVKRKMFLVKWAGLGYEYCTWETQEDINDDALIAEFRRLNNMTVDEPELPEAEISEVLSKTTHLNIDNAGGSSCIPDLRTQLYAQTRAFHFSKFGMELPSRLCVECGPKSLANVVANNSAACPALQRGTMKDTASDGAVHHPEAVIECVHDLVFKIARQEKQQELKSALLPPLLTGEYDAVVPITSKGLMMNVGEIHGSVAFLGYRTFPDGSKGPSELSNLIRNVGDKIIAVDGASTINKTFKEVIAMLRESGKNKYAYMRFLDTRYSTCSSELSSVGKAGLFMVEEVNKKFVADRRRLLVRRRRMLLDEAEDGEKKEEQDEESDGSVGLREDSDEEDSEMEGSEGEFEPDSDDDELVIKQRVREQLAKKKQAAAGKGLAQARPMDETSAVGETKSQPNGIPQPLTSCPVKVEQQDSRVSSSAEDYGEEEKKTGDTVRTPLPVTSRDKSNADAFTPRSAQDVIPAVASSSVGMSANLNSTALSDSRKKEEKENPILCRQETTRSLAYRLLDLEIGYSSDEGGDEDCAYFLDGVDSTFTTRKQAEANLNGAMDLGNAEEAKTPDDSGKNESRTGNDGNDNQFGAVVPVKRNEFTALGNRGKLCAAATLTSEEPDVDDFDNFPHLSTKKQAANKKAEAEAKERAEAEREAQERDRSYLASTDDSAEGKKSTTKVEQISTTTNDVIRVWANVEDAAATLQIPLKEIKHILKGGYDEDIGDEVGGYRWRWADEDAEVTQTAVSGRDNKKGKNAFLEFRDKLYDHNRPHEYKNGNRLRDYQVDGVNWLASCWYKRHSCILADEMGLGKTVQIVSYIEHLYRVEKIKRPFLVVVPLSTVEHWRREFEGWTDMQCCVYHDRQRVWRDVMREYEWYYADQPHTPDYLKFDVLVTTYDTLIGDFDVIGQIPWRVTVVDEAHRLRNVKGKLLECMKEISARGTLQYGFQSRVLMTGTPLQNNTQELWTLLNFIEPYKFPSLEDFQYNFGNMANRDQVESLQRKISPFMLRRVKEDVAKDIPAKEETVIDVELTSIQKQYYRAIFEHNHSFLSMGTTRATAPKLMNIQMELRKCCNHPFLLDGVETREMEKQRKELSETGALDDKTLEEQQHLFNEMGYIQTSGKMVLLDKLLPKLRQEGHKVLIFSQMVKMLDLISEYCDFRDFRHERLDGRVRGNERQKAIDRFETEEDSFVFLLSTRAGGVGINLTAADICIIFDSDWNPQNDVQAQARCHRIGQTKDVMIYRLITSRTFEQEMFDRASKKLGLEQAVLGTFGQDNEDDKPTSKEMEQLLKKGAYALLEDDNDEIGKDFCSDDIESILLKRTRTRVVEGAKTASWLNKAGMNVSKSKFTGDSAAATANVDVDDPLFWQKVMPDFVTPTIMLTKLNDLSKLLEKQNADGIARKKKAAEKKSESNDGDTKQEHETSGKEEPNGGPADKLHITRTNQKKVNKFMSDLKSMMDGIFEEEEDDALPQSEKTTCQKLLLTISVKDKLFTDEQRHLARIMLKRLEGDRRRRCRTSGETPARFKSSRGAVEAETERQTTGDERLLILSTHKRRKKRQREKMEKEAELEKKRRDTESLASSDKERGVDEDGYLRHSDSEADWSDIDDSMYHSGRKRTGISRKEAKRRRAWASDKDAATSAGRPWPSFPRKAVSKVLATVLDKVIKNDKEKGGLFSEPVPRDVFPEYYEQIKEPMDYGTMRAKLERGEYRSAQAMQKDFILVMSNCLKFNSPDSDIVQEARRQALMRPTLLKESAMEHKWFLAEDGSALEVYSDNEEEYKDEEGDEKASKKKRNKKGKKKKGSEKASTNDRKDKSKDRKSSTPESTSRRLVRCKQCEGCKREDCGECVACMDKPKFGGRGTLKQGCMARQCMNMREAITTPQRTRKHRHRTRRADADSLGNVGGENAKAEAENRGDGDSTATEKEDDGSVVGSSPSLKKPRIRISLPLRDSASNKTKDEQGTTEGEKRKKKKKKKRADSLAVDNKSEEDSLSSRNKRKRNPVEMLEAGRAEDAVEGEKGDFNLSLLDQPIKRKKRKKSHLQDADNDKEEGEIKDEDFKRGKEEAEDAKGSAREESNTSLGALQDDSGTESEDDGDIPKKAMSKTEAAVVPMVDASVASVSYMDVAAFREEREKLDGTFAAARSFFTKHGPWVLPSAVGEGRFNDVAKNTLNKMLRHDTYSLFAEKVTNEEAPGYFDVVKNPMDFSTMREKLKEGKYGKGSEAIAGLYQDFLLVMDNCALYNDDEGEVIDEAARLCGLLPESFASSCHAVAGKKKNSKKRKRKR